MNNILLSIVLSFLLMIILLVKNKFRVEPIILLTFTLLQTFIGFSLLSNNFKNLLEFFIGIFFLILGYFYGEKINKNINKKQKKTKSKENVKFLFLEIIIYIMVGYHFIVGGIPILSNDVEIQRFNFSSSGLAGLPGRMYMYGLPYLYICSYFKYPSSNKNKVIIIIFLFSRVLGGIKSGIIEIIFIYFNLRYSTNNSIKLREFFKIKYIAILSLIVFFIFKLTQTYKTMQGIKIKEFLYYIIERLTVIQAMPIINIFELVNKKIVINSNYFKDSIYFLSKYTKISIFYKNYFTTDNIVSAYIYNTPILKDSFFVPVTMTAFGEFYLNNSYFVFIIMFGLGILSAYLLNKTKLINESAFVRAKFLFLFLILEGFLTKGGFAYSIINGLLLILIFKTIEFIGELIEIVFKIIKKNFRIE
ncbi:MAG: O-antigen polymerase [Fusobacteriaceae bacterium]